MNPTAYATLRTASLAAVAALPLSTMVACGGGGDPAMASASIQSRAEANANANADARTMATQVRLEGCIEAGLQTPSAGTPVRALAVDGRLLASGSSDAGGVFTLVVPARQTITVMIDGPGADAIDVLSGGASLSLGACLHDAPAPAAMSAL